MTRVRVGVALFALTAFFALGCERRPAPDAGDASAPPVEGARLAAELRFEREGQEGRSVALRELLATIPAEEFRAYDPYYAHEKTWRAVPLVRVLEAGFGRATKLAELDFVLRAKDGYSVPLPGTKVTEPGAYVAFEDVEVSGWEPIGPQRANPGPFYVVWRNADQQNLETHPRPWQLASIEIAPFETTHPHTFPRGASEIAVRGFRLFRQQCIACHAINREGGRVGPELNVPQSIVEYRPEPQIRAYIKDPRTFRYGNMPAHPGMTEVELDALVAYFRAMRERKHDPEADAGR